MVDSITAVSAARHRGSAADVSLNEAAALRSVTLGQMISAGLVGQGLPSASATGAAAVTNSSGGKGAIDPPAELRQYGNGRVPRSMLTLIGIGQHRLWAPAAEAFTAMRAAAAADGVSLSVTDSYRSYEQQVALAQEKGLTQNGGWAATPGTSEHGWGLAVDVDVDTRGLDWLKANGATYGWVMRMTREPWHWEFAGPSAATPPA